jgi:hypothetical protein
MTNEEWKDILFGKNAEVNEIMKKADAKIAEVISDTHSGVDEQTRLMVIHALVSYFDFYLTDVLTKHIQVDSDLMEMTRKWAQVAADIDIAHVLDNADPFMDVDDVDPLDRITMKGGDA